MVPSIRWDDMMKVALVYDRINKWGGAERVLLALHELWPNAPLYTSVYDKRATPWADTFEVRTSFLQKLPLPKNAHELYPFLMGIAFESFNFDEFDLVVSVTHEFAKAILTKPKTRHVCYCLTPTSYLWSGYESYFQNDILRQLSKPLVRYLRWYDKIVANRPDSYIAISKTVQARIKKYYGQESDIIYPPVTIPPSTQNLEPSNYFLVVSRLVPNKRLDITVKAFNELGLPLKIVGVGSQERRLRSMAKKNVKFLGFLSEEELASVYRQCRAVIIPGVEDFNIVSVEAQGFGKPVVAYNRGGVTETVIPGKTGWFFAPHTAQALADLITKLNFGRIKSSDCLANAQKFSKERFLKEFLSYVQRR